MPHDLEQQQSIFNQIYDENNSSENYDSQNSD